MPNSIGAAVTKFTSRLDEVLMQGTVTSDLNLNQDLLGEMRGNGTIEIATIAMDGLADHVRGAGFVPGGMELTWEPYQLECERDREFSIDVMDDEERMLILSAKAMNTFAREQVIPEVDAFRFARMAENAGNSEYEVFTAAQAALDAFDTAVEAIEDEGGDPEQCILYCSPAYRTLLKKAQPWRVAEGGTPDRRFDVIDGTRIKPVPKKRFNSAIKLLDGKTTGEEKGGFVVAEDGLPLNFMLVDPRAVAAITKHEKLRYFAPDTNQKDDAHLWQYRLFHDLLVYAQKKGLIYASFNGTKPAEPTKPATPPQEG